MMKNILEILKPLLEPSGARCFFCRNCFI